MEKIKLDLRGLGFYGFQMNSRIKDAINDSILHMENFGEIHEVIYKSNGTYRYDISSVEINKAISVIKNLIDKNDNLDWYLDFINISVSKTGSVKRGTIIKKDDNDEDWILSLSDFICIYLA